MKSMTLHIGKLFIALTLATLVGSSPAWAETRLRAELEGNAIMGLVPGGKADFRDRLPKKDRQRFSAEVEDVDLEGDTLNVWVHATLTCDGELIGTITVGGPPDRGGDLNLDSKDGDTVPDMSEGDIISVCDDSDVLILSGSLQEK